MKGYNLTPAEFENQELSKWQSVSNQKRTKLTQLQRYKTPLRIILSLCVCIFFFVISADNDKQNNEYPVSATQLTKQSFQKADYKYRENPEYFLRADETCDPLVINLGGQYTHFHFGYYLLNIYGDEGGMRFTVYADGSPVLDTGYLWPGTNATPSYNPLNINYEDLNVTGISQLELRADYNGASDPYDTTRRVMITDAFAYNKNWDICVLDEARVLNSDQTSKLEEYAHNIRKKYGVDFLIITTSDPQGVNLQSFGNGYYNRYRYNQYDDRIIVVAYFDGQTVGGGYATQVCKTSNIFFYGPKANQIQENDLNYQGLINYYNSIDNQEYYSAFSYILNGNYSIGVINSNESSTTSKKTVLLIVAVVAIGIINGLISLFYSSKENEIKTGETIVQDSIQKYKQQYQKAKEELERATTAVHKEMDSLSCYELDIRPFLSLLKRGCSETTKDMKELLSNVEETTNRLKTEVGVLNQKAESLDSSRRVSIHQR